MKNLKKIDCIIAYTIDLTKIPLADTANFI